MARKGHEEEQACSCDQAAGICAGWAVRRLSRDRVRELAEEIWTASTGGVTPAVRSPDPRGSRPGASAQATYEDRRRREHEAWQLGWRWRAVTVAGAAVTFGLLAGFSLGPSLILPLAALMTLLARWHLRFRPSAGTAAWRRQAGLQRRTADLLLSLEEKGYLVLHDVALPGWPASVAHLVVGSTGVWVVESRSSRSAPLTGASPGNGMAPGRASGATGLLRGLRAEAAAIADALAGGGVRIPVRSLLCVYRGARQGGRRSRDRSREWSVADLSTGVSTVSPRQLADAIRHGPQVPLREADQAAARAVEVLRPAA